MAATRFAAPRPRQLQPKETHRSRTVSGKSGAARGKMNLPPARRGPGVDERERCFDEFDERPSVHVGGDEQFAGKVHPASRRMPNGLALHDGPTWFSRVQRRKRGNRATRAQQQQNGQRQPAGRDAAEPIRTALDKPYSLLGEHTRPRVLFSAPSRKTRCCESYPERASGTHARKCWTRGGSSHTRGRVCSPRREFTVSAAHGSGLTRTRGAMARTRLVAKTASAPEAKPARKTLPIASASTSLPPVLRRARR